MALGQYYSVRVNKTRCTYCLTPLHGFKKSNFSHLHRIFFTIRIHLFENIIFFYELFFQIRSVNQYEKFWGQRSDLHSTIKVHCYFIQMRQLWSSPSKYKFLSTTATALSICNRFTMPYLLKHAFELCPSSLML